MSEKWPQIKGPCPICGKKRCKISPDGGAVMCWRVVDGAFKLSAAGHGIHHLDGKTEVKQMPVNTREPVVHDHDHWARWIRAAQMRYSVGPQLGESLNLKEEPLKRIGVGVLTYKELAGQLKTSCKGTHAWSFPMYNERRRPVGIRLRSTSGFKYSVNGSHAGVFMDVNMPKMVRHLWVVEGATDTAAAIQMGQHVIGRPSNVGNTELVAACVRQLQPVWTTIIVDNDKPGTASSRATWRGAEELKEALGGMDVMITPPLGNYKDVRDSLSAKCYYCGRSMFEVSGDVGNVTHDDKLWCGCVKPS